MFTSNLVGVGQQYYLNKTDPLPSKSKFKKKEKGSMPDERTAAGKKPFHREHPRRGEARLDQERAIAELTRYLDAGAARDGARARICDFRAGDGRWRAGRKRYRGGV